MEFRPLGNSGVRVSCFALGSWMTYEFMPEHEALAVNPERHRAGIRLSGRCPLRRPHRASPAQDRLFGSVIRSPCSRGRLAAGRPVYF